MTIEFNMARNLAATARTRTSKQALTRQALRRSIARTGIRLPALATTLPTLAAPATASATTGTSWLPSDYLTATKYNKLYSFLRATWGQAGTVYPNHDFYGAVAVNANATSLRSGPSPLVRFWCAAPDLEIFNNVRAAASDGGYRLRVDGDYVMTGTTGFIAGQAGGFCYQRVTWGDGSAANAKMRLYEIEAVGDLRFGGIKSSPLYRPMPAPIADALVGAVHGDSFVDGTGSKPTNLLGALAGLIPVLLGQPNARGSGVGGSGFVATNNGSVYTFGQRVQTDIIAPAPDFIVEMGGYNDRSMVGGNAVFQLAVETWLAQVTSALPDVLIFMTGPMTPGTADVPTTTVRDLKKAAAAKFSNNVVFLDNIADEWVLGTGRSGAPTGNGNADYVTGGIDGADTVHPAPEGHVYLAQRVVQAIAGALG